MTKQEKQAIACKKYYDKNKDVLNAKSRQRFAKDKERILSYRKENRKLNFKRTLFLSIRSRCKRSGTEFLIHEVDIVIPEYCPLLGIKLDPWGDRDALPSVDRIDNTKGYIPGNIWVVSNLANRMKNSSTKIQLITFCKNVLNLLKET